MAYLYGKKFVGPLTPTILSLREDLYSIPYEQINWDKARDSCAKVCQLVPIFPTGFYILLFCIS
jgi:achilleol B synthase